MPTKILIPTPLRAYAEKHDSIEIAGTTVEEVLRNLTSRFTQLQRHLYNENGSLRSYVNVYVNDEDIRYLQKEKTPLKESDVISIIPSIAGGTEVNTLTVEREIQLSNEEILRYSRHLIIPEVGMQGQKRLKAAKVLLVGAGGLGSPLALYLAAAGVGKIGIVDFDVVDVTNLQRQVLHSTEDVGRSKLESARETIHGINPHVSVETYEVRLSSDNALELFAGYDVVIDGTDNFPTRYLVNDACVLLGKPNVYGSIFRFDGQVAVFDAQRGPCYRCLYPAPPPPGLVPSCAEGGVLGVLPGIVGSLQALETIKLIVGQGDLLIGRLVLFDALKFTFRELRLKKNPDCPICGNVPTIRELIDYEQFCGIERSPGNGNDHQQDQISVEQLKTRLDHGDDLYILDVREPHEYEIVNIGGHLIPLGELPEKIHTLDSSKEIIVHCKLGGRSAKAVDFLKKSGFKKVKNLIGGIDAWADRVDRTLPRY
ncbi:MAG: molybdopterin-synthase adenylyltransferase MoeB [Ignavibacteria bacterium]|nr:molybdopterin-synthase adenylyltransferase MoeB [Ignavibacteria bacterium]MBI3766846.1 molybdopterin-synthase adenylyltransferase MoeB [Ignavibacteriales bacterium]